MQFSYSTWPGYFFVLAFAIGFAILGILFLISALRIEKEGEYTSFTAIRHYPYYLKMLVHINTLKGKSLEV